MKKLIFTTALATIVFGLQAQKQKITTTDTFKVSGNCGMCEKRIEAAASKVKGVDKADWDAEKGIMILTYDLGETSVESVQKAIAEVGHDTEKVKADDKVYSKLPGCCQYNRL